MMISGKSATLFGPWSGIVFFLFVWFAWLTCESTFKAKTRTMIVKTRSEERSIAALLGEQASIIGGLTNLNQKFILDTLFTSNQNPFQLNTNAAGAMVDIWQTPYKFELFGQTNFVVRSAGKDKKFGTEDDIIFNSLSNDFVKP
jgi:SNF family Na+-dependent transporter